MTAKIDATERAKQAVIAIEIACKCNEKANPDLSNIDGLVALLLDRPLGSNMEPTQEETNKALALYHIEDPTDEQRYVASQIAASAIRIHHHLQTRSPARASTITA